MNSSCWLSWVSYYLTNWIIPALIVIVLAFLFLMLFAKKARKCNNEIYERSFANQKEMTGLLKEIRDLLKRG